MLYNNYVKLFSGNTLSKLISDNKGLSKSISDLLIKSAEPLTGDTLQVLTDIRQKFLVGWVNSGMAKQYPFRLFDLHRQLVEAKIFNAYNQWLFGEAANEDRYAKWQTSHAAEAGQWKQLQSSVVFKIPAGQYYTN